MLPVHCRTQRGFNTWHNLMFKFGNNTRKRRFHHNSSKFKSLIWFVMNKAFCLVMHIVKPAAKPVFSTSWKLKGRRCVPVHIRSSLLQHGLFSHENLIWVQDVEEVDGHEERHRNILPHGVGHVVIWVDHCVLARKGERSYSSAPSN